MKLLEQIFRILAPSNCLNCGLEGSLLCAWCREEALPETDSRCYRCNKLTQNSSTCRACRRHTPIRHLWARSEYTEKAKALVHAMKFKYSGEATEIIAKELASTIPVLPRGTVVVHVPTITRHVRQRGFDQAKELAVGLSRYSNFRHAAALGRTGKARQVGAKRQQRLTQVEGSFWPRTPYLVKDCPVLLVDDVLTTGATLEAAARVLKAAGARSVDAVVFARAK